jgi:hypothetical protein
MRLSFVAGLILGAVGTLRGQSIETPTPFDSAHRVLAVTPPIAVRLGLAPPIWPVSGEFRDVRLYSVSPTGGFVLVVQRSTAGVLERFPLTEAQARALQMVIDSAMAASGRPSNLGSVPSEPAGNSFARRQLLLGAFVYGPLAASLANDGQVAGALYLLTAGTTFFASYGAAQSGQITRAQSHLAADLGLASGVAGLLVAHAATGDWSGKGVRGAALGSAFVGTLGGVALGRNLTDAEAHAATGGIEAGAATSWSLAAALGASSRATSASIVAGEGLGYLVGLQYPRWASYTVTAGDADAVQTAGLLGAAVGATIISGSNHPSNQAIAAAVGPTYLLGLVVGDAAIARQFNLTESDATIANVGAVAGGLVGAAIPLLAGSNNTTFTLGAATAGAMLGMTAVIGLANASPEHPVQASGLRRVSLGGAGLLGIALHRPGSYPIAQIRF